MPAFQPIVDLKDGRISSFEVLARWNDSELGIVNPSIFIPLVEQAGLLDQMMDRLIRAACTYAASWDGKFYLTFNISPTQFACRHLAEKISQCAQDSGFPVDRIQLEITENAIFDDTNRVKSAVEDIKSRGMRIILDDFGTGHSSLVRLQSVPFDKIKIDAGFVRTMEVRKDSCKIISAVIGLGQSLGLSIVAEGVENDVQFEMLKQLGCDYGQGYYFSKPVFADVAPDLLSKFGQAAREKRPVEMSCNRRLAELHALYEDEQLRIAFIDTELRFTSISKGFCNSVGIDGAWATGRPITEIFPGNADVLRAVTDAVVGQGSFIIREITLNTDEGLVSIQFAPARDEVGVVIGISIRIMNHRRDINQYCYEIEHRSLRRAR